MYVSSTREINRRKLANAAILAIGQLMNYFDKKGTKAVTDLTEPVKVQSINFAENFEVMKCFWNVFTVFLKLNQGAKKQQKQSFALTQTLRSFKSFL